MKSLTSLCFFFYALLNSIYGQPNFPCGQNSNSMFITGDTAIYRIDSVDTNPTDPIWVSTNPGGLSSYGGIAIKNSPGSGPETLYFVSIAGIYYYWNGSSWINTAHPSGSPGAVNPGGVGNFLYNLDGGSGSIYRYDGSGNGTLFLSGLSTNNNAFYDVATDYSGNFYLYYNNLVVVMYNSAGTPVDSFTTSGFGQGGRCGLTLLGDRLYLLDCYNLWEGIKTGNNINFTMVKSFNELFTDMTSCPGGAIPLAINDHLLIQKLEMYPNPTNDKVKFAFANVDKLEITSCTGSLIRSIPSRGLTEFHLDVSDWEKGIYFINTVSENNNSSRCKLVVQ